MVTKNLITTSLLLISLASQCTQAATYSGEWADVSYYFSWMEENGNWHEWVELTNETEQLLYQDLTLKKEQPVKCKISVLTHVKSVVSMWLTEPGTEGTESFDVIEGEQHESVVRFYLNETGKALWIEPETLVEYVWAVKANDRWINARSPLNGYCQVTQPSVDSEMLRMTKSFANPYIKNEEWTGPSYSSGDDDDDGNTNINENNNKTTPGFETIILLLATISVMMLVQHQKKKNR